MKAWGAGLNSPGKRANDCGGQQATRGYRKVQVRKCIRPSVSSVLIDGQNKRNLPFSVICSDFVIVAPSNQWAANGAIELMLAVFDYDLSKNDRRNTQHITE